MERCSLLSSSVVFGFLFLVFMFHLSEQNTQIPKNLWKDLQSVESNADFINRYVNKKPPTGMKLKPVDKLLFPNDTVTGSFNQDGVATMAGMLAEADGCSPRDLTVTIPPSSDASIIYWPTCTKIQRCGGCCGTDMLECAPTRTDMLAVQVMQVRYTSDGNFDYSGLATVQLERHLDCDCRCRVQAHHCNSQKQDYDEHSCSCKCRNAVDATSCPSQKKWDEKECACICPRIFNCLDDEYFNFSTCSCQRGTGGQSPGAASNNPCAGRVCRVGYQAVQTGNTCACRLQT